MKKPDTPTKPGSIRVPHAHWTMLRALMQLQGRGWIEKAIEREYKLRFLK
jgi:hypothetical protein